MVNKTDVLTSNGCCMFYKDDTDINESCMLL